MQIHSYVKCLLIELMVRMQLSKQTVFNLNFDPLLFYVTSTVYYNEFQCSFHVFLSVNSDTMQIHGAVLNKKCYLLKVASQLNTAVFVFPCVDIFVISMPFIFIPGEKLSRKTGTV